MNIFTDIVPASARKYVYAVYALAGVVTGAFSVAGADVHKVPDVLAYLGVALGIVAASNVPDNGDSTDGLS